MFAKKIQTSENNKLAPSPCTKTYNLREIVQFMIKEASSHNHHEQKHIIAVEIEHFVIKVAPTHNHHVQKHVITSLTYVSFL